VKCGGPCWEAGRCWSLCIAHSKGSSVCGTKVWLAESGNGIGDLYVPEVILLA
jgi:hypothetical protein